MACAFLLGVDLGIPHRRSGGQPISQLAFTLANGFTYVESYLRARMHIDDFAPNLSFFFRNGMRPRVQRASVVSRRRNLGGGR